MHSLGQFVCVVQMCVCTHLCLLLTLSSLSRWTSELQNVLLQTQLLIHLFTLTEREQKKHSDV